MHHELRTERLVLRRWMTSDREPFAALNSHPEVMRYFPGVLSRQESDALADRIASSFDVNGFGLWAVEVPNVAPFIGFTGLSIPRFEAHFTPCVEIGWRLDVKHWNRGFATEAARAALQFGFEKLRLKEIISFTVPDNLRSRKVMEQIGMSHSSADDFDHPFLPVGHPLQRHVLYRISAPGRA